MEECNLSLYKDAFGTGLFLGLKLLVVLFIFVVLPGFLSPIVGVFLVGSVLGTIDEYRQIMYLEKLQDEINENRKNRTYNP